MGSLLLPSACGILDSPQVLRPDELCSDHSDDAIPTFEDARLEDAALRELNSGGDIFDVLNRHDELTCGLISSLRVLSHDGAFRTSGRIESLVGVQNLTNVSSLQLCNNSITDLSPLSGLTALTNLSLFGNSITDLGPLSGLTSLTQLLLHDNPISDIQPLLDNTGLVAGDDVSLVNTSVSCADVAALEAKGVTVDSDCP